MEGMGAIMGGEEEEEVHVIRKREMEDQEHKEWCTFILLKQILRQP